MIECVKEYLSNITSELGKNIEDMDMESIERAAHIIMESEKQGGRIHVTGIGKPGHVAGYIASLLSSTGTSAYELHGTEAVHGSSGQVKKGDVVIAISNSGETMELEATVQTLIANGAHIISCTGNPQSTLRASILSEILILQCLSVVLQEAKKLDLNQYVKWHPGGSLGKSIKELQK